MIGLSEIGNRHLGILAVSEPSLRPWPALRIIALTGGFISLPGILQSTPEMEQALKGDIFKASRYCYLPVWHGMMGMQAGGGPNEVVFKGVTGSGRVVYPRGLERDFDRRGGRGL